MAVGFVATTVFATTLLFVTVEEWSVFNHDHVSFWAWLLLYVTTPVLLPWLWSNNRRTDPGVVAPGDVRVPRPVRMAAGVGGALQLAFALVIVLAPHMVEPSWPWAVDLPTLRVLGAFVAFPAVTWLWFLVDDRWSSFRITQQTATLGMALLLVGALRSQVEFRPGRYGAYLAALLVALALNVWLYTAMERRARRAARKETSDETGEETALGGRGGTGGVWVRCGCDGRAACARRPGEGDRALRPRPLERAGV